MFVEDIFSSVQVAQSVFPLNSVSVWSMVIILAIVAEVYFVHWHVVDFIIALASWFVNSLSSACNIFGFCDFT